MSSSFEHIKARRYSGIYLFSFGSWCCEMVSKKHLLEMVVCGDFRDELVSPLLMVRESFPSRRLKCCVILFVCAL